MDTSERNPSSSVVIGRLVLLLVAAVALVSALVLAHAHDRDYARAGQSSATLYVCPMHPEVISRLPGECPICRMALERAHGDDEVAAADTRNGVVEMVKRRTITQLVRAPARLGTDGSVTAVLHKDDLVGLAPREPARYFATVTPGVGTAVHLSSHSPTAWDTSTVKVRFQLDGPAPAKQETGWLELAARPRELLVVPSSAVLYSGAGAYVLAAPPGGHKFTRRAVEIGKILDSGYVAGLNEDRYGAIVVLSGLREGEQIVAGDTFFLDAERRLQAAHGNLAEVTR